MKNKTVILILVATALLLSGAILFGGVMMALKWNFRMLSTVKFESCTYEITEKFTDISVLTDTADVVFVPTDGEAVVTCFQRKAEPHSVSVKDGKLVIELQPTEKRQFFGIQFDMPRITVAVPRGAYGELSVKTATGDVEIADAFTFEQISVTGSTGDVDCFASSGGSVKIEIRTGDVFLKRISAASLEIKSSTGKIEAVSVSCDGDASASVSTGDITLRDVSCKNLTSTGSTGDVFLSGVVADAQIEITRSTGDVRLNSCDASEISIKTTTGHVKGTLLTEKTFVASTSTGKTVIPQNGSGGRCEISTQTGNIKIEIE